MTKNCVKQKMTRREEVGLDGNSENDERKQTNIFFSNFAVDILFFFCVISVIKTRRRMDMRMIL